MNSKITIPELSLITLIALTLFLSSCGREKEKYTPRRVPGKNEIMSVNTYLVEKDRERILSYIERKNLKMHESPSGLWYMITEQGTGEFFRDKDIITFEYECSLLDGTVCYSSDSLGPKTISLGSTAIEPGLNEGFRMLKPGAGAVFILPPFLAWGLHGDDNKIPPRAVVVYKIRIIK